MQQQVLRVTAFPVTTGTSNTITGSYTDNFSNNKMLNWVHVGGSFNANNGSLNAGWIEAGGGGRAGKAYVPNSSYGNLNYEADIKLCDTGDAGVMFHAYKVAKGADAFNGYYAGYSAINNKVILGKCNGSSYTEIASVTKTIDANTYYHIKVEDVDGRIKVYFNNESSACISVNDQTYSSGMIGVRHYNSDAKFDNINVTVNTTSTPR